MADPADLAKFRLCERAGSEGEGAGGAKSNAPIPTLHKDVTEVQWSAWKSRFERWQLSSKISDKAVENRILQAIPNQLADQICVGLRG